MRKIQKIALISFSMFLVFLALIYIFLGGAEKIEITKTTSEEYLLIGKKYAGKRSKKDFKKLMDEIANLVKTNQLKGTFAVYHFINPDSEQDTLNSMVGVIVNTSPQISMQDFVIEQIPTSEIIRATIKSHWLVAPNPTEVNRQIKDFAEKNHLSLSDKILEKYYEDKEIITEVAIR